MEWTIDHWEKDGIVYVKLLNPLKMENLKILCRQVKVFADEYKLHRLLVDQRGVAITLSVLDIDRVPDISKEVGTDSLDKTALLLDPSARAADKAAGKAVDKYEFIKNVLALQSIKFQIYSDLDDAVAWLKS